jgi:DNA-binding transcriptional LysR family regulator
LVRLSGGRSLQANNAEVFLPALRAGLGLALQPDFLVWQDLRDGTLESVLDDWQGDPLALHIVTPPGRRRPARVQALVDYLAEGLVGAPWAQHRNLPRLTVNSTA